MARATNEVSKSIWYRIFGGYGQLLKMKGTARYAIGAVIASMPFPMVGMCITISVQSIYGSYALAGTLSAVQAISVAILTPIFGRLIDSFGQTRVSVPIVGVWILAAISMMTGIQMHAPVWVLYLIAPFMAFIPPWGAMSRKRWTYLLKDAENSDDKINRAFGLSSILDEAMWMIGNPLSSVLAVISGVLSFSVTGICVAIGAVMFLSVRYAEPPSQTELAQQAGMTRKEYRAAQLEAAAKLDNDESSASGKRATIFSLGFIALCVTWFGLGAFQSASGLSVIAFAREQGIQSYTGFVFACFSGSALIGATIYGAKNWTIPLWKRFYFCIVVVAVGMGTFMFAKNIGVIIITYLIIGLCQSPTWINGNQILLHIVPASRFTEAAAIMGAMNSVGGSVGNAITGVFIDRYGSFGGFATVTVLTAFAVIIAFTGLKQIREATLKPMLASVEV